MTLAESIGYKGMILIGLLGLWGYFAGALRHNKSTKSRGGLSKSCRCKHDLGCTVEPINLWVSCSLHSVRLMSPARNRVNRIKKAGKNDVKNSFQYSWPLLQPLLPPPCKQATGWVGGVSATSVPHLSHYSGPIAPTVQNNDRQLWSAVFSPMMTPNNIRLSPFVTQIYSCNTGLREKFCCHFREDHGQTLTRLSFIY